ncbi:hypothetical protein ES705_21819 [subsurface metagenome]|nr:hypothetical protein [Methanosarcinales archaeon]
MICNTLMKKGSGKEEEKLGSRLKKLCLSVTALVGLILTGIFLCPICIVGACFVGTAAHFNMPLCIINTATGIVILSLALNVNRILIKYRTEFKFQLTIITILIFLLVIAIYKVVGIL